MLFSLPVLYSHFKDYADIKVIDCPSLKMECPELIEKIKEFNPDIIGVSVPSSDMLQSSLQVLEQINIKFPEKKVIVGGVHPTLCPEDYDNFDCEVVVGEGEPRLKELLEITEELKQQFIDWSCIPFEMHNRKYSIAQGKKVRYMPIYTSQGCIYNCNFCSNWILSGRKMTFKDVDFVIAELKYLLKTYGVKYILFTDELFTVNKKRTTEICQRIIDEKMDFKWMCQTRCNLIDKELLDIMKLAGCETISFGIESGNDDILKSINKGETKQEMIDGIKLVKESGLITFGGFILGHYEDTFKTMWDTIKFADELDIDCPHFFVAMPYPKTALKQIMDKPMDVKFMQRLAEVYFYLKKPRRIKPLIMRRIQ